ncbi:MAG: winged helix-turn-helix domain-containing protein [Pseudomonadales bacterium]
MEPHLNRIARDGVVRHLQPKNMDVLVCLLERADDVISVRSLLANAWPGRIVEPGAVHQRISSIRSALGDDPKHPRYIENVPRRGYRIIADVHKISHEGLDSSAANRGADGATRLAVLPLRDVSREQAFGWLAEALTADLRRQIPVWRGFQVVPGTLHRDAGVEDLRAFTDLILEGQIQAHGAGVSVTLDLIDVAQRATLWSESFEVDDVEAAELQRHLSRLVANFFGQTVAGYIPKPERAAAFLPFLRFARRRIYGDTDEEIFWLEEALAADPDWAAGWATLALAQGRLFNMTLDAEWRARSRSSLARAKAVSKRPEKEWFPYAVHLDILVEGNLRAAEERARVAIEKAGYVATYGLLLMASGLYEEASRLLRCGTERFPHDPTGWEYLAWAQANLGDVQGALAAARQLARLWPNRALLARYPWAWSLPRAGRFDEARSLLEELDEAIARLRPDALYRLLLVDVKVRLAFELAFQQGDRDGARRAIVEHRPVNPSLAGALYLCLDDPKGVPLFRDAARVAACERWGWWQRRAHLSVLQRSNPAVVEFEAALGITPTWRHELARRASQLPASCHLRIDPDAYA